MISKRTKQKKSLAIKNALVLRNFILTEYPRFKNKHKANGSNPFSVMKFFYRRTKTDPRMIDLLDVHALEAASVSLSSNFERHPERLLFLFPINLILYNSKINNLSQKLLQRYTDLAEISLLWNNNILECFYFSDDIETQNFQSALLLDLNLLPDDISEKFEELIYILNSTQDSLISVIKDFSGQYTEFSCYDKLIQVTEDKIDINIKIAHFKDEVELFTNKIKAKKTIDLIKEKCEEVIVFETEIIDRVSPSFFINAILQSLSFGRLSFDTNIKSDNRQYDFLNNAYYFGKQLSTDPTNNKNNQYCNLQQLNQVIDVWKKLCVDKIGCKLLIDAERIVNEHRNFYYNRRNQQNQKTPIQLFIGYEGSQIEKEVLQIFT